MDTSVFGGYFDQEFEEFTKPLFKRINNGEFIVLLSAVLQRELEPAPEIVINLIKELKNEFTDFINQADLLVSWNFKHIVNVDRIRGYNSINIKNGYRHLEIRSPRDLINYGN